VYVCIHGEKVAIVYITPQTDKIDAYNYAEKLGAPSHVRAVSFTELQGMIEKAGLVNQKVGSYKLDGTKKDTACIISKTRGYK
jgi:hypothetical protein